MAHLLEHLVFKGTPDHPDIPKELTERGARPNGTAWFDRTNYFETFTSTDENLEWALDLEADLENVPIERLQAFYRKYHQPDNAMLVIAGRFDPDRAKELVIQNFGAIPRPERVGENILWPTYTAEPDQDGERTVTLRRVWDTQLVMAVHHIPPGSHDDFAAVDVLSNVLGDEPSGRLYKGLVETRAALEDVFGDVVTNPPTAEEVERARASLLKQFDQTVKNSERLALDLTEWGSMGDWRLFFLHRDRLKEVRPERVRQWPLLTSNPRIADLSVDEINEAMRRHIDLSRITVVKAGDFAGVSEDPELVP